MNKLIDKVKTSNKGCDTAGFQPKLLEHSALRNLSTKALEEKSEWREGIVIFVARTARNADLKAIKAVR